MDQEFVIATAGPDGVPAYGAIHLTPDHGFDGLRVVRMLSPGEFQTACDQTKAMVRLVLALAR